MKKKLKWSSLPSSIKQVQHDSLSQIKSKSSILNAADYALESAPIASSSPNFTPVAWVEYYLGGYSSRVQQQVHHLITTGKVTDYLAKKYPQDHRVKNDHALYEYVHTIKQRYMRKAATINKVCYDEQLQTVQHALGTHTYVSRVQGQKLKAKHEIRIASVFKHAPLDLLCMIVVHELAHCKEKQHNKAFYQLCIHMQAKYHQVELDTRIFLLNRSIKNQKRS